MYGLALHFENMWVVIGSILAVWLDAKFASVWQDPQPAFWTLDIELLFWLMLFFGWLIIPWHVATRIKRMTGARTEGLPGLAYGIQKLK